MSVRTTTQAAAQTISETEYNRIIVAHFVDLFYNQRKVRLAFETYVSEAVYIQHNPNVPDGREAAITMLAPKVGAPEFHAEVKRIIVDGPLAVVHLFVRVQPAQRGAAVADIFRLDDGKIVEHWDVLQPIPEQTVSLHPMF